MTNANAAAPVAKIVVSAITLGFGASINKGQLAFASSIAFETLPMVTKDPKFKFAQFARDVEEASNYSISAKTVANCATLANQLQLKYGEKIGSYVGGFNKANVGNFVEFVANEVKGTTYRLTLEDLIAFCKGEQSAQDKRAAAAQALAAAAAALEEAKSTAAAKELSAATDAAVADAAKATADAANAIKQAEEQAAAAAAAAEKEAAEKIEAAKRAESLAADNQRLKAEAAAAEVLAAAAAAEKEAARKVDESFALKVGVNADGTPNIVFALNMSPVFLRAVANEVLAAAKAMEKSALKAA